MKGVWLKQDSWWLMQPCTHDIVFIVYAWMCICMNAWMTTRLVWLYGGLTCMIVWMIDLMEQDWTGKMESDPTSHHKHLAIFNGDDATRVYQNSDGVKSGVCSNWWGINISWENVPIPKYMVEELVLLWSCTSFHLIFSKTKNNNELILI